MARRTQFALLLCVAVVAIAAMTAFAVVSIDLSSDTNPSFLEQRVARTLLVLNLRFRRLREPPAKDALQKDIDRGAHLYQQQCSLCHGSNGGNPAPLANSFSPRPPQFASQGVRNDASMNAYVIRHGIRWTAMPAFPTLSDEDAWRIARYLESLNQNATP
jgi:mono/diheme cytochrome c family protein